MPTTLTLHLTSPQPLFFDEAWPLEATFRTVLAEAEISIPNTELLPYTLAPLMPKRPPGRPSLNLSEQTPYYWQITWLDDGLTSRILAAFQQLDALIFGEMTLTVTDVQAKLQPYGELVSRTHDWAKRKPKAVRFADLSITTPALLHRQGLALPLPDPVMVFHYYLAAWNCFAPHSMGINANLLDGVAAHVTITAHQLETRSVTITDVGTRTGLLGQVTYQMIAGHKLGLDFLGQWQSLVHLAPFCGTGDWTQQGFGQTQLGAKGQ